jgi:ribosomal RNA-processing protein 17
MNELDGSSTTSPEGEGNSDKDVEVWQGFPEPPAVDYEAEYIDEDRYTMVTVEELDLLKDGVPKVEADREGQGEAAKPSRTETHELRPAKPEKRAWTKENPNRPKKKRKKFRYESKAERKVTRYKEQLKRKAKAKARRSA